MNRTKRFNNVIPYLFILPAVLLLFIFKIYPIFNSLIDSFYGTQVGSNPQEFVGFANYLDVFKDPFFWDSVKVTMKFNLLVTPIQITLAFALALLLNIKVRGIGLYRSIHFIPVTVSMPIAAVIWDILLNKDQGVVNSILTKIGIGAQPFLSSTDQALWVIILIATWKGVGYWSIFLLGGLQDIPISLYESAEIDGATKWNKFKSITFPLMKRTLLFVVVADTVTNFLLFAPMYLLTGGGPQGSTNVLMLESYKNAFVYSNRPKSAVLIIILLFIIMGIVGIQSKLLKSDY